MTWNFKKILTTSFIFFMASGCQSILDGIVSNSDDKPFRVHNLDNKNIELIFTHNVNGETHPCGCRHFPLGGLPQVAGALEESRQKNHLIYIDTGDMLFPSANLPENIKKSSSFTADNLLKAMDGMGLNYFVPGDQDFAKGFDFLKEVAQKAKFDFLIANLSDEKSIKHKRWVSYQKGPHRLFLTGLIEPTTLPYQFRALLNSPSEALGKVIEEMTKEGYDSKNEFHRLVLLSHSGMSADELLVKKYPQIDWVLGAHSQNFIRVPIPEGKTRLVQVLSRNHYLGKVTIDLAQSSSKDKYEIIEIRDEFKDKLKPNPWLSFIDKHKEELSKVQEEEQREHQLKLHGEKPIPTAKSCIDCHYEQKEKWQSTAHSLAMVTLINADAQNNGQCIGCHSVGFNSEKGFNQFENMASQNLKVRGSTSEYWSAVKKEFSHIESVRKLTPKEINKNAKKWEALEDKHKVVVNYANVQCLNCHDTNSEHPFGKAPANGDMKKKCLSCHTQDQAPEWYIKQENGLPGDLDQNIFQEKLKFIACPKQ